MTALACLRKRRYGSKAEAQRAIFSIRARNQDADRLGVERCEFCKQWHLKRVEAGKIALPPIQLPIESESNVEGSP